MFIYFVALKISALNILDYGYTNSGINLYQYQGQYQQFLLISKSVKHVIQVPILLFVHY